jgi:Flp pilus assembly protein TadD
MPNGRTRALVFAAASLWLTGCGSTGNLSKIFAAKTPQTDATSALAAAPEPADAAPPPLGVPPEVADRLLGSDPNDDLSLGKKQYRAGNYGVAERYYRHAAELHSRDAEAWLGLAACYDQLRRFDLADRAYREAIRIVGPTVAILNNQGYSYLLRGDYARARVTLRQAQHADPGNQYVANNLRLLQASARQGKAVK